MINKILKSIRNYARVFTELDIKQDRISLNDPDKLMKMNNRQFKAYLYITK